MKVGIRKVMTDEDLFGQQFGGESWAAWRALLCLFYAEPMDADELKLLKRITGLSEAAQIECIKLWMELWLVMGRRAGKSYVAALIAVFEAAFRDHRDKLAPGELATVFGISPDRKQSRTFMRYVSGLLHSNPMLERMIVREDKESIELSNRSVIEVGTASFRTVRGYSCAAVILDEIAYFRSDESANPDHEILAALRPSLATLDGRVIALSSPYAKRGELWNTYRQHFGNPSGEILVAQADTRTMNPSLPERVITQAYNRDPVSAAAEYGAQFRDDISQFIGRAIVEQAIRPSPLECPHTNRHSYFAFTDPAGGGQDGFSLAVGHNEGQRVVVDVLRERRGAPGAIVAEYAKLLKNYGIHRVMGDRYGGDWPAQEFARHKITFKHSPKPKSDLYSDALSALNSERVELPPSDKLVNQFLGLERKTSRAGRDSIDHGPGGHDDLANAVAGLIAASSTQTKPISKTTVMSGGHY